MSNMQNLNKLSLTQNLCSWEFVSLMEKITLNVNNLLLRFVVTLSTIEIFVDDASFIILSFKGIFDERVFMLMVESWVVFSA